MKKLAEQAPQAKRRSGSKLSQAGRIDGARRATVTNNQDPLGKGRVKIKLPWLPAHNQVWARLATLMAGNNRGTWFIPDVNDEVLVVFEGGDPRQPYIIGALWSEADTPPAEMVGNNNLKVIRSRNGVQVTLDDADGQERLLLETPGGQKLTLRDGPGAVEIVDGNGNSIKLGPSGITVQASAKVTVKASTVEVSAGMVTCNAGMTKFSGVVQADTVICNSVVSASYSPGAGNIW